MSIGELAELARVSVRTLRHYDEIGLLRPGGRTVSGHRRYDLGDTERLQEILFYRELGFALPDIAALLDDPSTRPLDHLRRQAHLTRARIHRLERMLESLEKAMEAHTMGSELSPEERRRTFADFDHDEDEARETWGHTEQYAESVRRRASAGDTIEERAVRKEQSRKLDFDLAQLMKAGARPDSPEAMELAEQMRLSIDRNHYPCSHEFHRGLANMYVADTRFADHYERVAEGLAQYVHDAIHANADTAAH